MDAVTNKAFNKIIPYIKLIEKGLLKSPLSLHILVTDYCANKCNMCGHWKTENKREISLEKIKEIWDISNECGVESICLTGGDPLSHRNFEEILKLPRKFELGIITAGNFKKDFDYSLLKDLAWIRFSVDSLREDVYNTIRGRNNLNEILSNIIKSTEYNDNVGINFTIQKLNVEEIIDIVTFCIKNKLKRLILYPVHHAGDLELNKRDMSRIVKDLTRCIKEGYHFEIPENNIIFLSSVLLGVKQFKKPHTEVPCIINKVHLAIGANGNIYPCEVVADDTDIQGERDIILGNIYSDNFVDIWKKNFEKEFISDKCKICFSRYLPINEAYDEYKGKKIFI